MVVVIQHAAQPLASLDQACASTVARFWADYPVGQALVIAFGVVVGNEVLNGCPQRFLSKQDHLLQTGFLDGRAWINLIVWNETSLRRILRNYLVL